MPDDVCDDDEIIGDDDVSGKYAFEMDDGL